MSWDANSIFKKLLHGKRKSALLNLTWSGLLCRVVWSVSQLLYLLQRAGHFKFFSPSFFVGLELAVEKILHLHRDCQEYGPSKTEEISIAKSEFGDHGGSGHTSSKKLDAPRNVVGEVKYLHKR